jgi:hypothetical protein
MDRDYTYDLPVTDVLAVAHLVFKCRQLLTQHKVAGFETTESALGGDPRRKLVVCTDEAWEKDSDCLLIEWTCDPGSSDSVCAQVGRNTVILPKPDGTLVLKGDNLTFSLKASDTPEGKRLLDLIVQSAREGVTDAHTDMRETVEAHDIEPGCDFGDTVLEYDTAEILTPPDRAFLIAILVRAIEFGLKAGQRRDDGFIYYQTIQETVFGRQILQMRVGVLSEPELLPLRESSGLLCRAAPMLAMLLRPPFLMTFIWIPRPNRLCRTQPPTFQWFCWKMILQLNGTTG